MRRKQCKGGVFPSCSGFSQKPHGHASGGCIKKDLQMLGVFFEIVCHHPKKGGSTLSHITKSAADFRLPTSGLRKARSSARPHHLLLTALLHDHRDARDEVSSLLSSGPKGHALSAGASNRTKPRGETTGLTGRLIQLRSF